ncbi:hypothetical protein G6F36_014462 [Rhizopus arrhizus]|nr:hypothetical protein G6F36_014462 [Rhizopus arrhizus]
MEISEVLQEPSDFKSREEEENMYNLKKESEAEKSYGTPIQSKIEVFFNVHTAKLPSIKMFLVKKSEPVKSIVPISRGTAIKILRTTFAQGIIHNSLKKPITVAAIKKRKADDTVVKATSRIEQE